MRRHVLRVLTALAAAGLLSGCVPPQPAVDPEVWASSAYRGSGPAEIALVTNIATKDGRGAHSALIIDGPERVVYNPFGTWSHPAAPEKGDLHRGFSPEMEAWFIDYHARETYRVRVQRKRVSPEVAAEAIRRAEAFGPTGPARCTIAVSSVLRGLPGFEEFPVVFWPDRAAEAFAGLPGVETVLYVDDSPGDWSDHKNGWDGISEVRAVPQQNVAVAVPRTLPPVAPPKD